MNRLMKAEWYRVRHSSGFMRWLVILCMICAALPLLEDIELLHGNLAENLKGTDTISLACLMALFSALIVGGAYENKTAYYEVMAGNKIYQIVFSKVFVDAVLVSVSVFLSLGIYWLAIGVCNGIGEIDRLPLRFFLLFLVLFHVYTAGILIVTSTRQIFGAVLVYLRFAGAETLIMLFLQESLPEDMFAKIADWFTLIKLDKIVNFEYEITNHLIFAVIAGLLIESAVWFGISYIGMKKQIYK